MGAAVPPRGTTEVIEGWLGIAGETEEKWGKTHDQIREESRRYLEDEEKRAREMMRRFAAVIRSRS